MSLPGIFSSPATLQTAFEDGLERLLGTESLGGFILVLANALFDEQLLSRLQGSLLGSYREYQQSFSPNDTDDMTLNASGEDISVFKKVMQLGLENLAPVQYRRAGKWEMQFNPLRSLRPKRISAASASSLDREFAPEGFHFNKPFLDQEVFWSGQLEGIPVKLLYNKFPFAPLHGLLVPEPEQNHPQYLPERMHRFIYRLCQQMGDALPGIAIAYNAYGAGASVNHLHFQSFMRGTPLPVQHPSWKHNGGERPYPADCEVFSSADGSWQFIDQLHQQNIPYNLLYLPDRIICLPRRYQGSFDAPDWCLSFAWYELCGGMTTFTHDDYVKLDEHDIDAALSILKLSTEQAGQTPK